MTAHAQLNAGEFPPDAITFWVIYDHPKDHPKHFVLRPQFAVMGELKMPEHYGTVAEHFGRAMTIASHRVWLCNTLEEARALVPPGCTRFADPNPMIVESWMQ